jgi:hypothetical protein
MPMTEEGRRRVWLISAVQIYLKENLQKEEIGFTVI